MVQDQNIADIHLQQRAKESRITKAISPILHNEFREFFVLGMKEKVSQIKPNLETIQVNIDNSKLSDAEFRAFMKNVIPELLKRTCKV